ncbi:hypothetical protein DF186_21530, partial [Enterococcus hirae]
VQRQCRPRRVHRPPAGRGRHGVGDEAAGSVAEGRAAPGGQGLEGLGAVVGRQHGAVAARPQRDQRRREVPGTPAMQQPALAG